MIRPVRGCVASVLVAVLTSVGAGGPAPAGASSSTASAPSSTTLSVEGTLVPLVPATYGQPLATAAQVSVPGAVPDGWVYFVVDGLSHRADVAADGTASTTISGLRTGSHRFSATFVPRDPLQQAGSTSTETTVEVARAVPRAAVRVTGRRTDRVLGVRVRVRTPYATDATGKVAVTLKPRGAGTKRTKRVLLADGAARVALDRVRAGEHRVVVRYPGDAGTAPFRLTRDITVRRR